ncbi:BspA family leucine-rich repeat surface protein [Mycoplasma yeatsii]|uniref:BspA family leucine-rich repeat surface protein n=1 Tax=Mycoplasma yeatsii TaxID=51365 RepID=UPI0005B24D79|nr:BspA family leucine-rich repeat surface protein [Mycoplasma yeatsii]AJM71610.1 PARCEL domain-containing protein [Mycoplasma yeatsii GM274B]
MEKKRKSKIWVAIAGLGICFSFIGALAVEVLQNKKKTDSRMIDLSKEIPEDKRLLGILYTENKEKILEHKNNLRVILGTSKSDTKIESKEVTMEFNKNNPSVTITAKSDSKVVRGSVEIKFKKPDISSRVKDEDRDLGVFNVIDEQKVVDRIIERDILNVKKFYDDLNYEKFSEKFEININQQSRIVTIKAKDDSIYYSGQIDFRYQSPEFDTIGGIVKEVNELVDTQANTVLTRFYELNQSLFSQENVQITRDQLQVVVTQNTAKITLTGNKNYQGSVEVNLTVKKQFDTIQNLQKDINQLVDTNSTNVLNRFFELKQQTLKPFNITKNNLKVVVSNNTATVSIQNHADYQGSITINLSVIPQFSTLSGLKTNVDQLTNNSVDTVLDRFIQLNQTLFAQENVKITRDQLQVEVSGNTAKITLTGNKNYQGSITINLTVKNQFSSISGIVKEVNNLKNNDQQSVLNRFILLNSTRLNLHKITRSQLKVVVNDNVATITVINHPSYQGSIQVNLKSWLKVTKSYLGVLDNDGRESISSSVLRALNIQNNWNFSLNDLNIDVNGKDARIRGKAGKNKYFIGEINVEFGLTNLYDRGGGFIEPYYDLERIGFFKNIEGEWQIMNIDGKVTEVPEVLPSFITSLKDAFKGPNNEKRSGLYKGIEKWDTSNVTDMSGMFENVYNFNQDISNWDTSNVTNMSRMFKGAERFNQNINSWDTSNVTDMSGMFEKAKEFDRPLNSWDTSKVTNMSRMFAFAENFDHYIGDWDVSKVRDMSFMFYSATKYARYIGKWDLSSIQNFVSFGTGSQYAKTTFFRLFHIIPTILYNHLNVSFYKQPIPE